MRFRQLGEKRDCLRGSYLFHYLYRTRLSGRCYPLNVTQNILAMGVTMHLIIATGLVYFGIKTKKEWLSRGNDLSRRTFLWLSVPCPVCLTATFLACLMLSRLTRISNLRIGFLVGVYRLTTGEVIYVPENATE
ncbi:MAG: hypothetical protein C4B56_01460 [Candidatus Methanophagaceae archaeon]|nr:MAG: hypothetical protein C4B56_01460 [Methanophagales archaeon]